MSQELSSWNGGVAKQAITDAFDFHPAGFAVYQLGNNGTAHRELKRSDVGEGGVSS